MAKKTYEDEEKKMSVAPKPFPNYSAPPKNYTPAPKPTPKNPYEDTERRMSVNPDYKPVPKFVDVPPPSSRNRSRPKPKENTNTSDEGGAPQTPAQVAEAEINKKIQEGKAKDITAKEIVDATGGDLVRNKETIQKIVEIQKQQDREEVREIFRRAEEQSSTPASFSTGTSRDIKEQFPYLRTKGEKAKDYSIEFGKTVGSVIGDTVSSTGEAVGFLADTVDLEVNKIGSRLYERTGLSTGGKYVAKQDEAFFAKQLEEKYPNRQQGAINIALSGASLFGKTAAKTAAIVDTALNVQDFVSTTPALFKGDPQGAAGFAVTFIDQFSPGDIGKATKAVTTDINYNVRNIPLTTNNKIIDPYLEFAQEIKGSVETTSPELIIPDAPPVETRRTLKYKDKDILGKDVAVTVEKTNDTLLKTEQFSDGMLKMTETTPQKQTSKIINKDLQVVATKVVKGDYRGQYDIDIAVTDDVRAITQDINTISRSDTEILKSQKNILTEPVVAIKGDKSIGVGTATTKETITTRSSIYPESLGFGKQTRTNLTTLEIDTLSKDVTVNQNILVDGMSASTQDTDIMSENVTTKLKSAVLTDTQLTPKSKVLVEFEIKKETRVNIKTPKTQDYNLFLKDVGKKAQTVIQEIQIVNPNIQSNLSTRPEYSLTTNTDTNLKTELQTNIRTDYALLTDNVQRQYETDRSRSREQIRINFDSKQALEQTPKLKQIPNLKPKTDFILDFPQIITTTSTARQNFDIVKPAITITQNIKSNFLFDEQKNNKKDAYSAYTKERGKLLLINKQPLPRNEALRRAHLVVDNTAARSIILRKNGTTTKKDTTFNNTNDYRINKKGFYVEKNKHAIDTTGEKAQLRASRLIKLSRKKGLFNAIKGIR
jgi:hypothetical protein